MTVPARSPIPIPGSTAANIEVAGAVMTEEVRISNHNTVPKMGSILIVLCFYLEQ